MTNKKQKYIFFGVVGGTVMFAVFNRAAEIYYLSTGSSVDRLQMVLQQLEDSLIDSPMHIATQPQALLWGMAGIVCVILIILYRAFDSRQYMPGREHGSAQWGTSADIKPLTNLKNKEKNIILTQTEQLSIDTQKTKRNNNVLVVGGSGSGKTRFYLKPNLMQCHTSYVVTDPKGTVISECGHMLKNAKFNIKTFNVVDFKKSMHYNPFHYIRSEKDILKLVNTIIINTSGEDQKEKEDFWLKAERLLYQALIGYIYYEVEPEEQNFATLLDMLNCMEIKEEDEDYKNAIDLLFDELEGEKPNHFAVRQYKKYKMAAGKTAKSILVSCGARLSPFDIEELREITSYDELELDTLGDELNALFIITDDTDTTYNFVVAIMYTQLFNVLCNKADNVYGGRLPFHVRCLLDEFANIGKIPNFERLIAVIRSRGISASVIVQNLSQLKGLYDKQAGTIIGNCDTMLFLGSGEEDTLKSISEKVGKTTIDHQGTTTNKGANGGFSVNQQIIARELITPAEVGLLQTDECILFVRGIRPFKSKKYNIVGHPKYKELSDYNPNNSYDTQNEKKIELEKENEQIKKEIAQCDIIEINKLYTKQELEELDQISKEINQVMT